MYLGTWVCLLIFAPTDQPTPFGTDLAQQSVGAVARGLDRVDRLEVELKLAHVCPIPKPHVQEVISVAKRCRIVEAVFGSNDDQHACVTQEGLDRERELKVAEAVLERAEGFIIDSSRQRLCVYESIVAPYSPATWW